ncbi:exodeoxyribonuclease VII small subunit [Ferviditalea candida]|uniref:Exodeoxyribonuclease 7 small subunit n=1 Tax=Ferviditalea candida TaxID=3108399 RepID=A0ABU5ZJD2_9BACL|nr:exodeoxyribonuclease VII small subunit [Paenibacillaceae bacterium T2]
MEEKNNLSFEEAIEQLEQIVSRLEAGDVPLEQAIEWFQEGMRLSQFCSRKLDQFEKKIEILLEEDGELVKKPFGITIEDKGDSD